MAKIDLTFQELCREILEKGREYENKNRGVKRLQIPSYTFKHSFKDGFPAITNKKLYWKGIVTELLWFLRGDNDVKYLNENGVKIWNKDAYNWYVKHHSGNTSDNAGLLENPDGSFRMLTFEEFEAKSEGSVGRNYSVQWRDFQGVDQIKRLIEDMEKDIMSSRLKVNAWNPAEIFDTALPPCHSEFQVIGVPLNYEQRKVIALNNGFKESQIESHHRLDNLGIAEFGFELHWNQRSVDTFLGLPFNIASYGLLAKILEYVTGYKALGIEGTLKCVHFYDNQYEAVKQLLQREAGTHPACEITIEPPYVGQEAGTDTYKGFQEAVFDWKPSDFKLIGYTSDEAISVEMLAPKEL